MAHPPAGPIPLSVPQNHRRTTTDAHATSWDNAPKHRKKATHMIHVWQNVADCVDLQARENKILNRPGPTCSWAEGLWLAGTRILGTLFGAVHKKKMTIKPSRGDSHSANLARWAKLVRCPPQMPKNFCFRRINNDDDCWKGHTCEAYLSQSGVHHKCCSKR